MVCLLVCLFCLISLFGGEGGEVLVVFVYLFCLLGVSGRGEGGCYSRLFVCFVSLGREG